MAQLPADYAPPTRVDERRMLLGWAAGAELLAASFGLLIRFVDRLTGMRTQYVRFADYNGITTTREQRLQDIQCWRNR
jgi:hypothetical protein